jgi:hypothetical protein
MPEGVPHANHAHNSKVGYGHISEITLCSARGGNELHNGHTERPVVTGETGHLRTFGKDG